MKTMYYYVVNLQLDENGDLSGEKLISVYSIRNGIPFSEVEFYIPLKESSQVTTIKKIRELGLGDDFEVNEL